MRKRWWFVVVSSGTLLSGCGSVDPAKDCLPEFIQEYRQESGSLRLLDLCPGQALHLPAFGPQRTDALRIEFSGGDYFTVLTHVERSVATLEHDGQPCTWVTTHEIVRRHLSRDGQTHSSTMRDGVLLDETQARDLRLMQFGMVPRQAPVRAEVAAVNIEPSEFGVDCVADPLAITHATDKLDRICMPVAPLPQCPAFAVMAPLRARAESAELRATGRTSQLRFGSLGSLVDKSGWQPFP